MDRGVAMSGAAFGYSGSLFAAAGAMGAAVLLAKPSRWEEAKRALEKAPQPTESDALTVRRSYTPQPGAFFA